MSRKSFSYSMRTHSGDDVLAKMAEMGASADGGAPVLYCDSQGGCMFDDDRAPYLRALEELLNEPATAGKRLVQVVFRERQMISIWEERHEA